MEEIAHQINRLSIDFRRGIEELKDSINRQNENFKREKDAAILAARVEAQVAALQNDGNNDSTLQPALDNENHKKVRILIMHKLLVKLYVSENFHLSLFFVNEIMT